MNEHDRPYSKADRGMYKLTAGWASWRWLSGVSSKEKQWFLGTLRGRGGYQSWMAHLARGLQDPDFLLKFEGTSGLELMGKDKKTIQDLITLVDPPTTT